MFFSCSVKFYWICFAIHLFPTKDQCIRAQVPSADKDAKAIVDSKFDPKTIASILLYRSQAQCAAINQAVAKINNGKPLVDPKYVPLTNTKPYDDLIFALVSDSYTVFSQYLGHYLECQDETYIIMIYIQIDDREGFRDIYNGNHDQQLIGSVENQRSPFMNALKVWIQANRAAPGNGACYLGQLLVNDRSKWNDDRGSLEFILMKEAIEDTNTSLGCYGNNCSPAPNIFDDIKNNIKNHDLVDLYNSLVSYAQDHDSYFASKLHQYCDGTDGYTMWIILLTTRRGKGVSAMDDKFKNLYKTSLMDFIKTCKCDDAQLKDMLTVLADPKSAGQRQQTSGSDD